MRKETNKYKDPMDADRDYFETDELLKTLFGIGFAMAVVGGIVMFLVILIAKA